MKTLIIGKYELENDVDAKATPDGYEIFPECVEKFGIKPGDFDDADWGSNNSIIVYE